MFTMVFMKGPQLAPMINPSGGFQTIDPPHTDELDEPSLGLFMSSLGQQIVPPCGPPRVSLMPPIRAARTGIPDESLLVRQIKAYKIMTNLDLIQ